MVTCRDLSGDTGSDSPVWDIETVPDLKGFGAASDLDGKAEEEIRAALGDKFPKLIYHSIVCIGAPIAHHDGDHWVIDALGRHMSANDPRRS